MLGRYLRHAIPVAGVAAIVIVVGVYRQRAPAQPGNRSEAETTTRSAKLPRMVDLGADKCIPCKRMAPILAELKTEYAGRAKIEFIDVWKDPVAGEPYGARIIPTQIFFDRDGKEVSRHEGFLSKAEIVAKLKELGAG